MTITKTTNNSYRLKVYIPKEYRPYLGIQKGNYYEKRFKSRKEAKQAELEISIKIQSIEKGEEISASGSEMLFSDFYHSIWWESYKAGQTTSTNTPPTTVTIENTAQIFKNHILPMFGIYSLNFLNQNKQVVLQLMTNKANEYANFKTVRSYVNSIFDWAEELEYIESNKVSKILKRIKATKKIQLQSAKRDEELYLSEEELQEWFKAFESDLGANKISLKDYVLFYLTFFLGDRKSESYALQWKHIDFTKNEIHLVQALDRHGSIKSTKGNKKTIFKVPKEIMSLLQSWKIQQKEELTKFNIPQTDRLPILTLKAMSINLCTVII